MSDNVPEPSFRRAGPEDVIQVSHLVRRFFIRAGSVYGIPYDHESCLITVLDVIANGICLVGQQSCAGAKLMPFPYNRRVIVADVAWWYFEDKREIGIFDAMVKACREAGATVICAAALAPRTTGKRFYSVRGMALAESHFIGSLTENACNPEPKG